MQDCYQSGYLQWRAIILLYAAHTIGRSLRQDLRLGGKHFDLSLDGDESNEPAEVDEIKFIIHKSTANTTRSSTYLLHRFYPRLESMITDKQIHLRELLPGQNVNPTPKAKEQLPFLFSQIFQWANKLSKRWSNSVHHLPLKILQRPQPNVPSISLQLQSLHLKQIIGRCLSPYHCRCMREYSTSIKAA